MTLIWRIIKPEAITIKEFLVELPFSHVSAWKCRGLVTEEYLVKFLGYYFLFLHKCICCGYSLEAPRIPTEYSKTYVRGPPLRLTLNSGWCGKSCLSYKGTYHVILLAKLHGMYLYKTTTFPHQPPFHINHKGQFQRWLSYTGFTVCLYGELEKIIPEISPNTP